MSGKGSLLFALLLLSLRSKTCAYIKLLLCLLNRKFFYRGVLTPDEFLQAGDQLVFKCPTWRWESGQSSLRKSHLPKDRQFLITNRVHCLKRVKALQESLTEREVELDGDYNEEFAGWVETTVTGSDHIEVAEDIDVGTAGDASIYKEGSTLEAAAVSGLSGIALNDRHFTNNEEADDEQSISSIPDLATFNEENIVQPDAATLQSYFTAVEPEEKILRTRTYDISITYDKYHQVPRLWLIGYDQNGSPLNSEEIFEDIMQDYADQTVTMEMHPHIGHGTLAASIHPCRHASVMKNIIETLMRNGMPPPRVDQYLFLFLKFIQSVIPTINYDFTMEVDVAL